MESKEYKNLKEFLLSESTVLQKEEDNNPLYYMWAVLKSVNGKTEAEIKSSESLKKLFKKLDKFCDKYKKNIANLKKSFTPSDFLFGFKDATVDQQKEGVKRWLDQFIYKITWGIQSFNDWREMHEDWDELVNSEEMQTVIAEI